MEWVPNTQTFRFFSFLSIRSLFISVFSRSISCLGLVVCSLLHLSFFCVDTESNGFIWKYFWLCSAKRNLYGRKGLCLQCIVVRMELPYTIYTQRVDCARRNGSMNEELCYLLAAKELVKLFLLRQWWRGTTYTLTRFVLRAVTQWKPQKSCLLVVHDKSFVLHNRFLCVRCFTKQNKNNNNNKSFRC